MLVFDSVDNVLARTGDLPPAYLAGSAMTFDSTIAEVEDISRAYRQITEESFTGTPTYLLFDPTGALLAHVPGELTMADVERSCTARLRALVDLVQPSAVAPPPTLHGLRGSGLTQESRVSLRRALTRSSVITSALEPDVGVATDVEALGESSARLLEAFNATHAKLEAIKAAHEKGM